MVSQMVEMERSYLTAEVFREILASSHATDDLAEDAGARVRHRNVPHYSAICGSLIVWCACVLCMSKLITIRFHEDFQTAVDWLQQNLLCIFSWSSWCTLPASGSSALWPHC